MKLSYCATYPAGSARAAPAGPAVVMPAVGGALGGGVMPGRAHPALTRTVDFGGGSAAGATGSAVAAARGQRVLGN